MKKATILFMMFLMISCFVGCSSENTTPAGSETENTAESQMEQMNLSSFDKNTRIADVISNSSFEDYGRLIFPADTGYYSGDTLEELRLTWYNNISPDKTVEIVNYVLIVVMREKFYRCNSIVANPTEQDLGSRCFSSDDLDEFA